MPFDCGLLTGGGARDEADVAREAPGVAGDVGAAVVGEPLDRFGQAVHGPEAVLDGGDVPHRFPVAAVEREGDADLLAIVAADLQRIDAQYAACGAYIAGQRHEGCKRCGSIAIVSPARWRRSSRA